VTLKPYKSIRGECNSLLIINKSRFNGMIINVDSVKGANDILKKIKKEHHDASHNCYAYIIGKNSEFIKYSDDGEPGGTAGLPMLNVLVKNELTDVLAICTRYFGGVKLGGGGLVRAYRASMSKTLKNCDIITYVPCDIYSVVISYDIWSKIEVRVKAAHALIFKTEYLEKIHVTIGLKDEHKTDVFNIINQALKVKDAFEYFKTAYVAL